MATTSASTGPDTLINLKVNHDGFTKKLKLPLRDLGASTLETKLRALLFISPDANVLIERYSDSAASYVVLDKANVSVFKQLYRAAKAKQKLKLRITGVVPKDVEEEHKVVPKPVTVEDVPEAADHRSSRAAEKAAAPAIPTPVVHFPTTTTTPPSSTPVHIPHRLKVDDFVLRQWENNGNASAPRDRTPEQKLACPVFNSTATPEIAAAYALPALRPTFAVCCNSCDENIPNAHYHCSTCDDGDFDLCQSCVDNGVTCYSDSHWLIKRFVQDGALINSTTEIIAPKPKKLPEPAAKPTVEAPTLPAVRQVSAVSSPIMSLLNVRTCNNCVGEFPETDFVHCTSCYDFDLCISCFDKNNHGHHPKHGFVPAVEGMYLKAKTTSKLGPGRNHRHNAVCDGCDKFIYGVRHKCLDCPDWDYCDACVVNSGFIHPGHRFAPIYEGIKEVRASSYISRVHYGICCDGPLCGTSSRGASDTFIVGDRYKCAVCDNVDFCANCEASPANTHNKTHPLIKFKTPVRFVSVTTTGEHQDGQKMPTMGDRLSPIPAASPAEPEVPITVNREVLSTNVIQTVVDVKPTEETKPKIEEPVIKQEPVEEIPTAATPLTEADLGATFQSETVLDGTSMVPNKLFEQSWTLVNSGPGYWPAGCSVKYSGGDYMGHLDSTHPAGIRELATASESTICYNPVAPGQSRTFTVILRTPTRPGKVISYWRLSTKDGVKFGDRLWCEVDVSEPKIKQEPEFKEEAKSVAASESTTESQMIFPKLEKESPSSSILQDNTSDAAPVKDEEADDFEECDLNEWDEDDSENGFLTDEEYDILDASDEEYLEEEQKKVAKK